VVRNSVLLGAPPDTENQDVSKLSGASWGSVKWLSACQYLFLMSAKDKFLSTISKANM